MAFLVKRGQVIDQFRLLHDTAFMQCVGLTLTLPLDPLSEMMIEWKARTIEQAMKMHNPYPIFRNKINSFSSKWPDSEELIEWVKIGLEKEV